MQEPPYGAIENGREFLRRLADHYDFRDAHGHPLHNCVEFDGVRQCVEAMAEWINDTAGDWEPSEAQQGLTPIPDGYNEG